MSKIFISIASYRDPQLIPTIQNILDTAKSPEDLVFCIAWQRGIDELRRLDSYKQDSRFRIIEIPVEESRGACWARYKIQQMYQNEEYMLQLDSHHRMILHWDSELIAMHKMLLDEGVKKPLITSYLPSFKPSSYPDDAGDTPWTVTIQRYLPQGPPFLSPHPIQDFKNKSGPIPQRFISGHFLFGYGSFIEEVPYDPDFYFHGEETSLAARAFTHGYDLFAPHKILCWHYYGRDHEMRHWRNFTNWYDFDSKSFARFRSLFGMKDEKGKLEDPIEFGKYGFGNVRTLEDYERYAGLKFSTRQIHKDTLAQLPPPVSNYEDGLTNTVKLVVDVPFSAIPPDLDYDCIVVATLDEEGKDLYRKDYRDGDIKTFFAEKADNRTILRFEYNSDCNQLPCKVRIWPHSPTKEWLPVFHHNIPYR